MILNFITKYLIQYYDPYLTFIDISLLSSLNAHLAYSLRYYKISVVIRIWIYV